MGFGDPDKLRIAQLIGSNHMVRPLAATRRTCCGTLRLPVRCQCLGGLSGRSMLRAGRVCTCDTCRRRSTADRCLSCTQSMALGARCRRTSLCIMDTVVTHRLQPVGLAHQQLAM